MRKLAWPADGTTGGWGKALGRVLLPAALLFFVPLRPAHAYIDPNAAGPLYQMLFPLLVAVGSVIAMMRRYIKALWGRAVESLLNAFRRRPVGDEGDRPQ